MRRFLDEQKGFTLLETIIAISLVALLVNGLFMAWYFIESRQRSMEDYWQARETLDLAYETVLRTTRGQARLPIIISLDQSGISFTATDGSYWQFFRDGSDFKSIHGTETEILIKGICNSANFTLDNRVVSINIGVSTPLNWVDTTQVLEIRGRALVRNP